MTYSENNTLIPKVKSLLYAEQLQVKNKLMELGWRGQKNYTRFIILGRSRTGSNLLRGLLNEHAQIVVLGELFQNEQEIGWAYPGYSQSPKMLKLFHNQPVKFLGEKVFRNYPTQTAAVGFKIFYYHARSKNWQPVWDYLRNQQNLHVIHIKRRNLLKTHLSKKRAEQTDEWVNTTGQPQKPKSNSLRLDFAECQQDFEQTRAWETENDVFFREHPSLEIFYEDLARNYADEMQRVLTFLNITPQPLKPQTHKQARQALSDTIENYAELKSQFAGTQWASFFED